ncbi:MAG: TonB-dependent receptor, partial [Brevundimonas sp.]
MIRLKTVLLAGAAVALTGAPAYAQTTPADETPPPPSHQPADAPPAEDEDPTTVEALVVTSDPTAVRTSIDSTSYSLANDLQATTGSLADALRNIPSVDVDPEGGVSLRGDGNVTILVDGR